MKTTITLTDEQEGQVLADILGRHMNYQQHADLAKALFRRSPQHDGKILTSLRVVVRQVAKESNITVSTLLGLLK